MKRVFIFAIMFAAWFWIYQGITWFGMDIQGLSYTEHLDMFVP